MRSASVATGAAWGARPPAPEDPSSSGVIDLIDCDSGRVRPVRPVAEAEGSPVATGLRGLSAQPGGRQAAWGHDQVRTQAFRDWFGNSAVRERMVSSRQRFEDMAPLVVYHGTSGEHAAFETLRESWNTYTLIGSRQVRRHGIFFAENPAYASVYAEVCGRADGWEGSGTVMPVYLRIRNPFYLDQQSLSDFYGEKAQALDLARREGIGPGLEAAERAFQWARTLYNWEDTWSLFDDEDGASFVAWLRSEGYDGVFLQERGHGLPEEELQDVWVALDPQQVKSATGNCGAFDPGTADIRA